MIERSIWSSFWFGVRHPMLWLRDLCGGEAAAGGPLLERNGKAQADDRVRAVPGRPALRDAAQAGCHFQADVQAGLEGVFRECHVVLHPLDGGSQEPQFRPSLECGQGGDVREGRGALGVAHGFRPGQACDSRLRRAAVRAAVVEGELVAGLHEVAPRRGDQRLATGNVLLILRQKNLRHGAALDL